ncbi:MAG: phage distal tail protein [Monoglobaceae bacterium]
MMQLDFVSARGGILPLVDNDNFVLTGVDGMTKTDVSLSTSSISTMDGDVVNNAQAQPRSIVLYLEVKAEKNVEEVKRLVLSYIKPKLTGSLHWRQNSREIRISGIVEAIEMPRFSDKCVMQISMHCSQPYWEDAEFLVWEINQYLNLHYFPIQSGGLAFPAEGIPFGVYDYSRRRTFTNYGDVEVGAEITIIALSTVTNPILYDLTTNRFIGINVTLSAGDEIVITTQRGNKTITKNGVNIIDKIKPGSSWLQVNVGINEYMINSDDEADDNMYFTLSFKRRFV